MLTNVHLLLFYSIVLYSLAKTAGGLYFSLECKLHSYFMYVCMVITFSRVWINRVRLPILLVVRRTRKMNISLSPFAPENLVSLDGFGRPVPRQPAHSPYSG